MSAGQADKLSVVDTVPTEFPAEDEELEKLSQGVNASKIFRKLDARLLPLVTLLYLLSFLDRTNIGNAKIAGLVSDLHLTGLQYNLCAAMFFITYCLFEVPSNLALKVSRPSRWIPFIMFCWRIVMISMAFIKNFAGLLVARLFLGITEAGLFPGVTFYLCMWYPRTAQAQRISILSGTAALSGAFGGLLAYGIEKMAGIRGLAGWSWIFLLEGLATTVVALFSFFLMQDYPENATFLTDAERIWLVTTIKNDATGLSKAFKWKFLWQALRDPHTYLMIGVFLFVLIPAYSFSLFLPTIIAELGFSSSTAQLLSVPPNAAGCVLTILAGILSDRVHARGPFVLAGSITALVGYVVLFATRTAGAGYAGTMVAACGLFPSVALALAWAGGNAGGDVKKAVVIAMVIGVGNLGGVASSFIYRPQDSPRYHPRHATAISCLCVAIVLCITAMLEFARLNRKKDAAAKATEYEGKGDFEAVSIAQASGPHGSWWSDVQHALATLPVPVHMDWFGGPNVDSLNKALADLSSSLALNLRDNVIASSRLPLLQARTTTLTPPDLASMAAWRPYLNIVRAPLRAAMARLLASEHPLGVEVLRHPPYNIPRERRVCRFCRRHSCIEDETHVLFVCASPSLVALREPFYRQMLEDHTINLPYVLEFSTLSPAEALHILLHRKDEVLNTVAEYVHDVFELVRSTPVLAIQRDEEWAALLLERDPV